MTALSTHAPARRAWTALRPNSRVVWTLVPVLLAAGLYLSTYQTIVNGSPHPFTTDVGEHQNALPRWGTIHHSSYPLWTFLGSFFVSLLGLFGVEPAAAASLYSLAWGLLAIALLVALVMDLGVAGPWAALGALTVAVSTSFWVDASIAELHTATMAVSIAILLLGLRFGRTGARTDLLWLVFLFSQGIFHQRSVLLLAPAVLLLIWPHFLDIFRMGWRTWLAIAGLALLGPLTYLYLPLRVWSGADWVFGSPGTWDGLRALLLFNNAELVVEFEQSLADWLARGRNVAGILADDLPLPLLIAGLIGLWTPFVRALAGDGRQPSPKQRRSARFSGFRIGLALTSVWLVNLLLTLLIWEGRVSDAQLAAKLPVLVAAGIGIALLVEGLWQWSHAIGATAALAVVVALVWWSWQTRPFVLSITRDSSTQAIVAAVERVRPDPERRTTLTVPWGADYWALTYAQAFEGKLAGLNLVDHNANPREIIARGDRLLAADQTFHIFPPSTFEERLGALFLSTAAPGVFEISPEPITDPSLLAAESGIYPALFDLGNGIRIWGVKSEWAGPDDLLITTYWERTGPVDADYSVAVHLLAQDPPASEADLLDQDDKVHPVAGWNPTTRWRPGEIVRDQYLLTVPEGSNPAGIRLGMYRSDPEAGFINTPWLSLQLPER
jgi:hypothetical protein